MADVLLMTDTAAESLRNRVTSVAPDLHILELVDGVELSENELASITHAFFSADCWPDRTASFLRSCLSAPNLRWLQSASAGGDHPVFAKFQNRGVEVLFTPGGSAPSIAQTVMMMLLALVRGLPELLDAQSRRAWEVRSTVDVGDLRVGIVGMGSIGAEVAKLVAVTGAEVIGVRRTPRGDEPCETWPDARRDEVLASSDVIVLCMPLTDETHHSIGDREFSMMKPGSIIINVGRGNCVDEEAMISHLQSGHLGGAGLDVFAVEPLPEDSPLWSMPRVLVSPHSSGTTDRSIRRTEDAFVENLHKTRQA